MSYGIWLEIKGISVGIVSIKYFEGKRGWWGPKPIFWGLKTWRGFFMPRSGILGVTKLLPLALY